MFYLKCKFNYDKSSQPLGNKLLIDYLSQEDMDWNNSFESSRLQSSTKIGKSLVNDTLASLNIDTIFLTGNLSSDIMEVKELGRYKTFVVSDGTIAPPNQVQKMIEHGIEFVQSTTLLIEKYKCPHEWFQCPLSGNCFQKERQCDGYNDCKEDGFDENPNEIITACSNKIVVSGKDELSGLLYQKYMGVYEKMECVRLDQKLYLQLWFPTTIISVVVSCKTIQLKDLFQKKL